MMKKLIAAFSIFLFTVTAWAEPGLDILGLAKQDIKTIANNIPGKTGIGLLDGTFGDAAPPLKDLLARHKVSYWRAHLSNGPCQRNRNCENGEPGPNDFQVVAARAKKFEELHKQYLDVPCYISPRVEHDEKNKATVEKWYQIIKKEAPSCQAVCSPFTGYCPAGVLLEKHGNNAKADITSNDGESIYDSDSPIYRTSGRLHTLAWINRFNLRTTGEKTFTPPSKRTARARGADIVHTLRLLQPEPAAPGACPQIKKPSLWKTNAEDYNSKDARENKPLFISPIKTNQFDILNLQNQKIGCAKNYGTYSGGGNRYYVGSCSGQTAVELMDKASSEWGYLKGGGQCFAVNFIRRKGYYR